MRLLLIYKVGKMIYFSSEMMSNYKIFKTIDFKLFFSIFNFFQKFTHIK